MATDRSSWRAALGAAALLAGSALTAAVALPGAATAGPSIHAGTLEVPLNKSEVLNADRPIAKAMIGNDKIADILPISDRSIYVLGKAMGTTSLTLYDSAGRVISVMDVAVGPDVETLRTQIADLVPGEAINAKISNESVVLTGMVNNPGAVDRAVQLARSFAGDKVINLISVGSSQQVMLEVKFAEVSRGTNKEIGVRGSVINRNGTFEGVSGTGSRYVPGGTVTSSTNTTTSTNNSANGTTNTTTSSTTNSNLTGTNLGLSGTTGTISGSASDFTNLGTLNGQTFTGTGTAGASGTSSSGTEGSTFGDVTNSIGAATVGTFTTATSVLGSIMQMGSISDGFGIFRSNFKLGGLSLQGVLNAMEQKGMAKTLAQPTLVALSGEKASFLAGGEFPIPVAQSGGAGGNGNANITVEFKQFGVSLAFTPTVLSDKTINLIVEPEVSAIDPSASYSVGNIVIPGLKTRRASTTLELRDGESFAIAGLLSKDFQTSVRQIPILGSLPIIGALFRSSGFQKGETELLIVVTPHLVAPIRPDQVRLPTDRVKDPSEAETFLLGNAYHPQALPPAGPSNLDAGGGGTAAPPAPSAKTQELPAAPAPQTKGDQPAKESDYAY